MAMNRLFQRVTRAPLYSGIFGRFNPLYPIGGKILLSGKSIKEINLREHIDTGLGVACMTTNRDFATSHSMYGEWGNYDSESYCIHKPNSVVCLVDVSGLDLINIQDTTANEYKEVRTKQESESVAVIVLPTIMKGWYINEHLAEDPDQQFVHNPFYISPSDASLKLLEKELESAYVEILKLKIDSNFNENNPQAVEAVGNYHRILIQLSGGPKAFKEKLQKLMEDISLKGYKLDPNSARTLKNALSLTHDAGPKP